MLEFNDFIYHKSRLPQDSKEQEQFFKELEQKFIEEITGSPKAKAYLDKFKASDIEFFVKNYARQKVQIIRLYEYYNREYREMEEQGLYYHVSAEKALHAILQKKLFNLQLLWHAGKKQIKGVDICYDFTFWESHIESCPFIEPITEHEMGLMKEYLMNSTDYLDDFSMHSYYWQDYDFLTELDEDESMENMIDWYEFYDMRMGTGSLLILPNLKKEKEIFYMTLGRKESANRPPVPVEEPEDNRPMLLGFGNDILDFAKEYETDKHLMQIFKGYGHVYQKEHQDPDPDRIREAIETLLSADRQVHFPPNLNWNEAIMYAVTKYENTRTAEALDIVYDEYLMRLELGMLATETPAELAKAYEDAGIPQMVKKAILRGRLKNGEPEDFDY